MKSFSFFLAATFLLFSCIKKNPVDDSGGGNNNPGTPPPTVTLPNTTLIELVDRGVSAKGGYLIQPFTVYFPLKFTFRVAAEYSAQAAIIQESQLNNFKTMAAFTGFGVFNNQFGSVTVTLQPGEYYVAIRNTANGANLWSLELDYETSLPASDRAVLNDYMISEAVKIPSFTKYAKQFTIQSGYRYFLDGVSLHCPFKIVTPDQYAKFLNNEGYLYFTDYYTIGGSTPGFWELKLPPGTYYFVATVSREATLTYILERWKVN